VLNCCAGEDDSKCPYLKTTEKMMIYKPYPKVLTLQCPWSVQNYKNMELANFFRILGFTVKLGELYEIADEGNPANPEYHIKGFVCFNGGHYFSFIKSTDNGKWRWYNDTNPILEFEEIADIFEVIVQQRAPPYLIMYEQ